MKFKGFAEFGLLLASFSYALEKMAEDGDISLKLSEHSIPYKKEETFDDIVKEFEKLTKETKSISSFTEPEVEETAEEPEVEIPDEIIEAALEAKLQEETVDTEDLAVVNELRKRILEAFKEKESDTEEIFEAVSETVSEPVETAEETELEEPEEEIVYDRFFVETTADQADQLKKEIVNDFNDYIADVRSIYGRPSRLTSAIDSMVEHANIMKDIKKLYPNLEEAFINEYYRLKDAINSENAEDKKGVILHRLSFTEKNHLLAYADRIMSEGMVVNVNENKLIADVIRPIVTRNGKVMAEIFMVANTAAAYGGFYEGYLVK